MKRKIMFTSTEPIIPEGCSVSINFIEDIEAYHQELKDSFDIEIVSDIEDADEIIVVKVVGLSYKINKQTGEQDEQNKADV